MPLSDYSLDKYVAQELSELKSPTAKSVHDEFPNRDEWIPTFILKTIFKFQLPPERTALAFALLRRAQAAIEDYHDACVALDYAASRAKTITEYFCALRKLESSIAMLYQANDFARKALSTNLFETGDGTLLQRLNTIYNRSRHPDVTKLPSGHLHPVWVKNNGIYTDGAMVHFNEFEDLLRQIDRIAERTSQGNT